MTENAVKIYLLLFTAFQKAALWSWFWLCEVDLLIPEEVGVKEVKDSGSHAMSYNCKELLLGKHFGQWDFSSKLIGKILNKNGGIFVSIFP